MKKLFWDFLAFFVMCTSKIPRFPITDILLRSFSKIPMHNFCCPQKNLRHLSLVSCWLYWNIMARFLKNHKLSHKISLYIENLTIPTWKVVLKTICFNFMSRVNKETTTTLRNLVNPELKLKFLKNHMTPHIPQI